MRNDRRVVLEPNIENQAIAIDAQVKRVRPVIVSDRRKRVLFEKIVNRDLSLVLDVSSSIGSKWSAVRDATRAFINSFDAANDLLFALARLQPGQHVLDVAAGTGDTSILAAQRVGPTGRVLATDISDDMITVAADEVQKAGLANVEMTARYDARSDAHYHVRCEATGQVLDLPVPYDPNLPLKLDPELLDALRREGFEVTGHRLELIGHFRTGRCGDNS